MNYFIQHKYYLLSIFIHLTLFIVFSVYFDFFTKSKKLGSTEAQAVSAFIYQGNYTRPVSVQEKKEVKSNIAKNLVKIKAHSLKLNYSEESSENNVTQASHQHSISQGESASTLIALLHDAIQRKQNYPVSALEMQRQGKVTVAFDLFEDGHIANLRVLSGSGTSSLDRAAVQAVSDAAPFKELLRYIKNDQEYQIDIVFELA